MPDNQAENKGSDQMDDALAYATSAAEKMGAVQPQQAQANPEAAEEPDEADNQPAEEETPEEDWSPESGYDQWDASKYDPKDQNTWFHPGRYRTPSDAMRAKDASGEEARRLQQAVAELKSEMQTLKGTANQPQQASDIMADDKWRKLAEQEGISPELLKGAVAEVFGEVMRPAAFMADGRNKMLANRADYPTYAKDEPEFNQFIASNPSLQEEFQRIGSVDGYAAHRLAYNEFLRQRHAGEMATARDRGAGADAPAARKTAQVVGSRHRSTRTEIEKAEAEKQRKQKEAAHKRGMEYGDFREYANMELGDVPSIAEHPDLERMAEEYGG